MVRKIRRMSSAYSTFVGPPEVGTIKLPVAPLSTEQYLRMIEAGVFDSTDKVELIGGFITPMAPVGPEHNGSLFKLTKFFVPAAEKFELAVQATVSMAEGQVLEPDFALLTPRADGYMKALPGAADVLLVVELAASSIQSDRHVKLPIYAAAGIPEYWIVDLNQKTLEIYRKPVGDTYADQKKLSGDDEASPLACPEIVLRIVSLFS
jgi:Uma2 family endonuclease